MHQLCNHMFLFQRIRAQDYYEWPECAGVAYDPALSSLANEYSYSPSSSSYINSPSTQQLYYSQDALIGGLQYPPEWKKTSLQKTSPSKSAWPPSFESSHQLHTTENHSSNYHGHTDANKASSNSRSNTKEMPLEELINSFLEWYQPPQTSVQTKHTVNHHEPLCHTFMPNSGTHTNQPETTSAVNKRNTGASEYSEAPSQQQHSYAAPQQQQSYTVPRQQQSYSVPPQQPQNAHHLGHTPTTNSESLDLQHLINTFMEFVNGPNGEQTKQTAETNNHSTLPHQSHSSTISHQPYQQTQHKAAQKRTTGSQSPVSYTNVDHNLQQHHSESGSSMHHRQAVPNYPSFSDPNLAYTYDSHMPQEAHAQTFITDVDKSAISTNHPQTHYNSVFSTVSPPNNVQSLQTSEQASYSSAVSPTQTLSNTDLVNKYNSPPSHPQSIYTVPNQCHKPQTPNTQTDPLLFTDRSTPSTKQNHKTNTNTPTRNNSPSNQNSEQNAQNLMSPQPTGTPHDYDHHQLTTWSQQPSNAQQTSASTLTNNKQSTKSKQSPQDDLMKNVEMINEFLGKRFATNKPKQNTQQVTNNMNNNKQQNPQNAPKNSQQEMLFQQMIDDNFPQILESLAKTPAAVGKGGRNQNPKNSKRTLLQQIISDNLSGIMDSLNKNHPQFQNKNGEIDLRQLQNLLQ